MKNDLKTIILLPAMLICLLYVSFACKSNVEIKEKQMTERNVVVKIQSVALEGNLIGENPERTIYVYLPPSYPVSVKQYPVVYFLHGYGDSSRSLMSSTKGKLDSVFQNGENEFIFVVLDGNTRTGGSFYVNSPVSGNWEDFVTNEVTGYIDSHYRTLAKASSRAITGYSMGGYGAFNIALNHPGIFGLVSVFCPGVYADGNISAMWRSWGGWDDVKISYAQAFSPNTDNPPRYGNIPTFTSTDADNKIIADWDKGYGCWTEKIDRYIAAGGGLNGIQLNYSNSDNFSWIPTGTRFVSNLLTERSIQNELHSFSGGHIVPVDMIDNYFIPFFNKHLSYD